VKVKLQQEQSGMSLNSDLFAGFEQTMLFKKSFPRINAIRITMRPPERAAKL
jgi:hypothetical protein